jgi:hypothetical protein
MAPDRDLWLADFLLLMYQTETYFSLTLTLAGLVVSGEVIHPKEFFRLSAEAVDDGWRRSTGGQDSPWTAYFAGEASRLEREVEESIERTDAVIEELRKELPEGGRVRQNDPREDELHELAPHFVHLRRALIYPSHTPPVQLTFWRGRLADVAGFSFGRLGPPAQ